MLKGVVLALDYGDQRVGVAVSDSERRFALARGVVSAHPLERCVQELKSISAAEQVAHIIVGLPRTLAGTEGAQAEKTRTFAAALKEATRLPVTFVDERFTTAEAERAARAKGSAPDAEAARLILEAWLAHQGVA